LNKVGFKAWLEARPVQAKSLATRLSMVLRIERTLGALGIPHSDLDAAYDADGLASVKAALEGLKQDAERGGTAFQVLLPDSFKPLGRLQNAINFLRNYRDFRAGIAPRHDADADRIREHVLHQYIERARERDEETVSVSVMEVHGALGLTNAWANVCQALAGPKFQELAQVAPPERQGPEASSSTVFTFQLEAFSRLAVEATLLSRFGVPIKDVKKILAFETSAGRQIALDRERPAAQLWVEGVAPPGLEQQVYAARENRHHGLPPRLNHAGPEPCDVAQVRVRSMKELRALLEAYDGADGLNRDSLLAYKAAFLARYPDFEPTGFPAQTGGYHAEERAYKDALIAAADAAMADLVEADDKALGARLLDILVGRAGLASGLLGWRTDGRVTAIRQAHPGELEALTGRLARTDDVAQGVAAFVAAAWPLLDEGQESRPYSMTRNLPTMLAALVRPEAEYAINSDPVWRLGRVLLSRDLIGSHPLTQAEYEDVRGLARSLFQIMTDEWRWAPRDFWDVQGFVWAVHRSDAPPAEPEAEATFVTPSAPDPTNLILYGPPGTGKTYRTATEAVRLCTPAVDLGDRDAVMVEYNRLMASGRVEFVTFHQSYSYEDFVEGLRPIQGQEGAAGFRLEPEMGAFRRIARRAETSTGAGAQGFAVGDRRVFKMSIGEAANPDEAGFFDEALEGGHALLGFGEIDWSDDRFAQRDAFIQAWKDAEPETPPPTAMNVRVQCPYIFRNQMQAGDLVVVSKGNGLFRAIGLVDGPYEFIARDDEGYAHRRKVRWLWHDRAGVPVEEIYARGFSQKTLYRLERSELNMPALERYIASQQPSAGGPEQFVLIIDEINRANISKVFGELITLLEADKRAGPDGKGLRVRLPYSREMFGVPRNLHVIGTMNTADRSIALLDTALRRRFAFQELMPDPSCLAEVSDRCGVDLVQMLSVINERIEYLFDREHQIGHAYFMGCDSVEAVDAVMRSRVIPLLAEYFYEDWTKVAAVLGDLDGGGRFLERLTLRPPAGLGDDGDAEPRHRWQVMRAFGEGRYEGFR
jgi:5-methylcytosine-specific restriction enzyme B